MRENIPVSGKQPIRLRLNKRLYIILVCFLISALFWLLIALSHFYPATITFPVKYRNLPGQKVVMNDLPETITVQLRASGFKILSYDFQKKRNPIEIDVGAKLGNAIRSDVLSLATKSFLTEFSKELGNEVAITGFLPDSIVLNFSDRISKAVPVKLNLKITFEKQYDTTSSPSAEPSTVIVSGPPAVVNSINEVYTENLTFNNLKATVKKSVKLSRNKLLSFDAEQILVTVPVQKFTEGTAEVAVRTIRVPEGYSLKTFPDKVKVRYQVAITDYNKVNPAAFDIVVDGSDLDKNRPAKIPVTLLEKPDFIRLPLIEPERLDYILRK